MALIRNSYGWIIGDEMLLFRNGAPRTLNEQAPTGRSLHSIAAIGGSDGDGVDWVS
jgi:hypothetical protein